MMCAPGNRRMAVLHQHRRRPVRIERQEALATLPGPLLDQLRRRAVFAQHDAHEARMRAERMVEQYHHGGAVPVATINRSAKPPDVACVRLRGVCFHRSRRYAQQCCLRGDLVGAACGEQMTEQEHSWQNSREPFYSLA